MPEPLKIEVIYTRQDRENKTDRYRLYSTLRNMKRRCYNPKVHNYAQYGGKGITVCREWLNDFNSFYTWSMENGYRQGLTIDRKESNKGYTPSNCRWVPREVNQRNKSSYKNSATPFINVYKVYEG